MIIGISGIKRSGKDTCADYLVDKYKFVKLSFAKPIKDACKILFGFSDDQLYGDTKEDIDNRWGASPRKVLQYVGTDLFRKQIGNIIPNIGEDFWVRSLQYQCENYLKNNINITIADVRFQNEIDMIHSTGGYVIQLNRPSLSLDDLHESETDIYKLKNIDFNMTNDSSIEKLYEKIDNVFKSI